MSLTVFQGVKCPIFPLFWKIPIFFLFFTEIPIFSYFSAVLFDFHIIFSQKLKEASEIHIRRISCSVKSHSCEIASLHWSFPPKWSHDQLASAVLPQSRIVWQFHWDHFGSRIADNHYFFARFSVFMHFYGRFTVLEVAVSVWIEVSRP